MVWVLDSYNSVRVESPCNSLWQGHLGLDFQKAWYKSSKQGPFFWVFFREISCFILSCAFRNFRLGKRSKGNIFLIPELWWWQVTNAHLHQGCLDVVFLWGGRIPSCSLRGCSMGEGAHVVQDHPPGFHVPLWVFFLSWREHAPLWLLQLSIGKENKAAEAHLSLIRSHLFVGEAPPCETLFKLRIHCRSPAVSWPVHNYLKHFDPYCVLSIHQAVAAVSDQFWKTPPLTVTTSDKLGFVFHHSRGFLRPDMVVLCCLSYKINL